MVRNGTVPKVPVCRPCLVAQGLKQIGTEWYRTKSTRLPAKPYLTGSDSKAPDLEILPVLQHSLQPAGK